MENEQLYRILFALPSIIIAISLHEMMHAFTGYYLGDDTAKLQGRISVNPLVHVDLFTTIALPLLLVLAGQAPIGAAKPVPFNPSRLRYEEYGAALLAIAGPLTNLVLAVLGAWVFKLSSGYETMQLASFIFTTVNMGFFIFNMLPIPPLDGSRVFYAFAPQPIRDVMDSIERMGFLVLLAVLFLALPALRPLLDWANTSLLQLIV